MNTEKVKVHNGELFMELLLNADWSPTPAQLHSIAVQKSRQKKQQALFGADMEESRAHMLAAKQIQKEQAFKERFERTKRDTERKTKENERAKEIDFQRRFHRFITEHKTISQMVDDNVREREYWDNRKKERLHNEWVRNVFNPMQEAISSSVAKMSVRFMEERKRAMYQAYIDESNKRDIFRDIINEGSYSPTVFKDQCIKYAPSAFRKDPTLNKQTRDKDDSDASISAASGHPTRKLKPLAEESNRTRNFPTTMWACIEATPHGRYSLDNPRLAPAGSKMVSPLSRTNLVIDHYSVPSGRESDELLRTEWDSKGKSIPEFSPHSVKYLARRDPDTDIANCFKTPDKVVSPAQQRYQANKLKNKTAEFIPPVRALSSLY